MADDGDITPMEEGMIALHEVYLSFRKGGFTRGEATSIIAKMAMELLQAGLDDAAGDGTG